MNTVMGTKGPPSKPYTGARMRGVVATQSCRTNIQSSVRNPVFLTDNTVYFPFATAFMA